jgi:hypothetical protein
MLTWILLTRVLARQARGYRDSGRMNRLINFIGIDINLSILTFDTVLYPADRWCCCCCLELSIGRYVMGDNEDSGELTDDRVTNGNI